MQSSSTSGWRAIFAAWQIIDVLPLSHLSLGMKMTIQAIFGVKASVLEQPLIGHLSWEVRQLIASTQRGRSVILRAASGTMDCGENERSRPDRIAIKRLAANRVATNRIAALRCHLLLRSHLLLIAQNFA